MTDSKRVQIQIEDPFYDGNPKKTFTLVPEAGGKGWRLKPIDPYQSIPVKVVRKNALGKPEVILQVGTTTGNLYDPKNLPLLKEGDEITVGMVNQLIVTLSKEGRWELKPKDPSLEIRLTSPHD